MGKQIDECYTGQQITTQSQLIRLSFSLFSLPLVNTAASTAKLKGKVDHLRTFMFDSSKNDTNAGWALKPKLIFK